MALGEADFPPLLPFNWLAFKSAILGYRPTPVEDELACDSIELFLGVFDGD